MSRLSDGTYIAVYDTDAPAAIGYTLSRDGTHWSAGQALIVQEKGGVWATEVRTPLGLIDEGNGTFTLFYTANEKVSGSEPDPNGINNTPGSVGMVEVRWEKSGSGN